MEKKSKCCGVNESTFGTCANCGLPFVPSQPNSEECCASCTKGGEREIYSCKKCKCHSPKPEENTYEKISKETERSARLASDKMCGYPLLDTTEEKTYTVDPGTKTFGYTHTSNEWEKWVKVLANSKNPRDTDLLIVKIKVLLDESEQRVRKEMVEQQIDKVKHKFNGYGGVLGFTKQDIINLISK